MGAEPEQRSDVAAVQSLAEEVEAAETAVREGDAGLSTADRVALDAARKLVRTVRHHAEADDRTAAPGLAERAAEHRSQEGGGIR